MTIEINETQKEQMLYILYQRMHNLTSDIELCLRVVDSKHLNYWAGEYAHAKELYELIKDN